MTRLGFYIIYGNKYKLVKTISVPWNFETNKPDEINVEGSSPIIGEWEPMKYVLYPDNIIYEDEYQIVIKEKIDLSMTEENNIERLYRITHNNIGIYEAVRLQISAEEWQDFLNNENVNWLYKPDDYDSSYISYFTEKGYKKFKEKTLPLILNIFKEEDIETNIIEIVREEAIIPPNEDEDKNIVAQSEEETEPQPPSFEDWFFNYFFDEIIKDEKFFDVFNNHRCYIIIAEENENIMGLMSVYKGKTILNLKTHDYRKIINEAFPEIRKDITTADFSFGGYDEDINFSYKDEQDNKK